MDLGDGGASTASSVTTVLNARYIKQFTTDQNLTQVQVILMG
jgi:hypothetical protein